MKNLLLLLLALIVVPAWAGDTAPAAQTGVVIELKGPAQSTSALIAGLEKEAVYKNAACSTAAANKTGETTQINCAKTDSALMAYLSSHAAANVQWSISGAAPTAAGQSPAAILACPPGCVMMACPPPGGPLACCKKIATGYVAC